MQQAEKERLYFWPAGCQTNHLVLMSAVTTSARRGHRDAAADVDLAIWPDGDALGLLAGDERVDDGLAVFGSRGADTSR